MEVQWIPRSGNKRADLLRRFVDKVKFYHRPFYASYYNSQLGSYGIDALAQDWSSVNNWMCPTVHLIVTAIRTLEGSHSRGTRILPEWSPSYYWTFCTIVAAIFDLSS